MGSHKAWDGSDSGVGQTDANSNLASYFYQYGVSNDLTVFDLDAFAQSATSTGSTGGVGSTASGGVLTNYYSSAGQAQTGQTGSGHFDIWVQFNGTGWTADLQKPFVAMANYLTKIITTDIGGGAVYQGKLIDDLFISAEVKKIDGVGGILGQAGPSAVWNNNALTAAGTMSFDVADATSLVGKHAWDDVVSHEFMHVLGFGSLWNYGSHAGLVNGYKYVGPNALAAYKTIAPSATSIPVENNGGAGTAGSHWDEQTLVGPGAPSGVPGGVNKFELMTGWIDPAQQAKDYLSDYSVKVLADLGYHLDNESNWPPSPLVA